MPIGTWLQAIGMLTLEPERLTLMRPQPEWKIVGDGPGATSETLKRLAISVFLDRSFLLFSKRLR